MNRLLYMIAGVAIAATPVAAQNLTLPAGSVPLRAYRADEAVGQLAQPFALEQGRSAYEHHEVLRHRRMHR